MAGRSGQQGLEAIGGLVHNQGGERNNEYLCSAHILIFIQFGVAA